MVLFISSGCGHPLLSPNNLFVMFPTFIERSLKRKYSNKIKNNLSSKINPCLSPEINVSNIFERGCVGYVVRDGIEWRILTFISSSPIPWNLC